MTNMGQAKEQLEREKTECQEKARQIDSALREPRSADWEEHATEVEDEEVLEDMGCRMLKEIGEIDMALHRIELGTYGQCTECGMRIGDKRLAVLPAAAHCIKCEDDVQRQ